MKYIRFFIVLLVPFIVMAEECNNNDIILKRITKIDCKGNVEKVESANIDNLDPFIIYTN